MHLPLRSVSWSNLQRAGRRATAELCGWCGQSLLGWWRASPGRCVQGGTQQSGACGRRTEWNGGRSEPVAIREHVILLAKWRWKGSTWSTVDLRDLQWIYMIYSGSAWSTVDLRDLQLLRHTYRIRMCSLYLVTVRGSRYDTSLKIHAFCVVKIFCQGHNKWYALWFFCTLLSK